MLQTERKLKTLRDEFDGAFAAPRKLPGAASVSVLMIRIASAPFAVRSADIAGVLMRGKVVRAPGTAPGLLGLAGIRGRLVAVYRLESVLGQGTGSDGDRWLLLCGPDPSVALSIERFERCQKASPDCLHAVAGGEACRKHMREVFDDGVVVRPVVDIHSVLEAIRNAAGIAEQERSL